MIRIGEIGCLSHYKSAIYSSAVVNATPLCSRVSGFLGSNPDWRRNREHSSVSIFGWKPVKKIEFTSAHGTVILTLITTNKRPLLYLVDISFLIKCKHKSIAAIPLSKMVKCWEFVFERTWAYLSAYIFLQCVLLPWHAFYLWSVLK